MPPQPRNTFSRVEFRFFESGTASRKFGIATDLHTLDFGLIHHLRQDLAKSEYYRNEPRLSYLTMP